jgi:hypothetical protein
MALIRSSSSRSRHRLCIPMVAVGDFFTGHHHEVAYTENMRRENIPLQGHTVAIPAVNMNDCFHTLLVDKRPAGKCAHPHYTVIHVRYDDRIDPPFDSSRIGDQLRYIHTFGRIHFRQDYKFA